MDKMDTRKQKGLQIAQTWPIEEAKNGWTVQSQSSDTRTYFVVKERNRRVPLGCNCPDFAEHNRKCKHMYAVTAMLGGQQPDQNPPLDGQNEQKPLVDEKTHKPTYPQNWTVYNKS